MATRDIDTALHITHHSVYLGDNTRVGQTSIYSTSAHPGTLKTIEGWKWDQRYWPTKKELEAISLAPSIWDPSTDYIPETYFQSGYGDNNDLLLLDIQNNVASGLELWSPRINHGYFYSRDEEWYLYSDWYQTEQIYKSPVVSGVTGLLATSGVQYADLDYRYKPTMPIKVRRFSYDRSTQKHSIDTEFRKVVEFTSVSGNNEEFIVDTSQSPPRIILDADYNDAVGGDLSYVAPGVVDSVSANALEFLGLSNGASNQKFYFEYSPIDPSQQVDVWSYSTMSNFQSWSLVSGVTPFTSGQSYEVNLDYDLGILTFGNYSNTDGSGAGAIPTAGHRIAARYTKGVSVSYEPEHARDYLVAHTADINPINAALDKGFIQLNTQSLLPAYIVLTAPDVSLVGSYYPVNLGNSITKLIGTVYDINGVTIEGEEVTFEILSPEFGSFGIYGNNLKSSSDSDGEATAYFNSPSTIDEIGQASVSPTYPGGTTTSFRITNLLNPGTVSGVYLYKVHDNDQTLGVADTTVTGLYNTFLTEEGITTGGTNTALWEVEHRDRNDLTRIESYTTSQTSKGKKTIVLTTGRASTIDPHTGLYDATKYVPLYPTSITDYSTDASPELEINYNTVLSPIGTSNTKAYFLIAETYTRVRASVYNQRQNRRIYSNIIKLKIIIPDSANGTLFANSLTDFEEGLLTSARDVTIMSDANINLTSGVENNWDYYMDERLLISGVYETYVAWYKRTRRGDSTGFEDNAIGLSGIWEPGLPVVTLSNAAGEIPMGWRIKSAGITAASLLDQVTYLDPNDVLSSGFFD